jgi:hypothetical protein
MKFKILASGKKQVIDPSDSPDLADAVISGCATPRSTNAWVEWVERKVRERAEKAKEQAA